VSSAVQSIFNRRGHRGTQRIHDPIKSTVT
jgi:hypothetical protein